MRDQVLSIERMQHLKELGVDTSKASIFWCTTGPYEWDTFLILTNKVECLDLIPAFTLQDMLEMMPCKLFCDETGYAANLQPILLSQTCYLTFTKHDTGKYEIAYISRKQEYLHYINGKTILEAAYNMLCWLAENKLLGKEEKK